MFRHLLSFGNARRKLELGREGLPNQKRKPVRFACCECLESRIAPAGVIYVDQAWTGDALGSNPGGPGPAHNFGVDSFATIQSAVNAATAGETIMVYAGTYTETVTVNKTLTLEGAGAGIDAASRNIPESIIAAPASGGYFNTPLVIAANNVTVDGFTIQGQTNVNVFGAGVYIQSGTSGTIFQNNIVQNNVIGLDVANNSATVQTVIQHNLFRDNTQPGAGSGQDIYADQYTAGSGMQNVLIQNNTFTNSVFVEDDWGVAIANEGATTFQNISVLNNSFSNAGRAMYFYGTQKSTISGNSIDGATHYGIGLFGDSYGLPQPNSNFTISGNKFTNTATGLLLEDDAPSLAYTGVITVYNNDFSGATLGIDNSSTAATVNAAGNWWGSNLQAQIASQINGTAIYSPWLTTGTNVAVGTGFQGDFSALTVDPASPPNLSSGYIQAGVNLLTPGGTLHVDAGFYPELVTITKSMTLLGAQAGVDARTGRPGAAESVVSNSGGDFQIEADNVTINGFTIEGVTDPNGLVAGIWTNPGYSGTHGGYEILNNIIQGNIMGIYLNNDGTYLADVKYNLLVNNSAPGPANGSAIYSDLGLSNANIQYNTFEGNNFSAAINIVGAAPQTGIAIDSNQFNNGNQIGLFDTSGAVVSNNQFSGTLPTAADNGPAIYIGGGDASTSVTGNLFTNLAANAITVENIYGVGANSNVSIVSNTINQDVGLLPASTPMISVTDANGVTTLQYNHITLSGVLPSGVTTVDGVALGGAASGTVNFLDNIFDGGQVASYTGNSADGAAIRILSGFPTGSAVTITGNTLSGWPVAFSNPTGNPIPLGTNDFGAYKTALESDYIQFTDGAGSITGTGDLVIAPALVTDSIGINGGSGTLQFTNADLLALGSGFAGLEFGYAGTGAHQIAYDTTAAYTFGVPVTFHSPATGGTFATTGPNALTSNAAITVDGSGDGTTLYAGIVTAGALITIDDGVTAAADITLDATNGGAAPAGANIAITGSINSAAAGPHALTLHAGTAGDAFFGHGGAAGTADIGALHGLGSFSVTAASVTFSSDVALVATDNTGGSGAITIDSAESILGGNILFDSTNGGISPTGADISFVGAIDSASSAPHSLSINAGTAGTAAFGSGGAPGTADIGALHGLASLNILAGTVTFASDVASITTTDVAASGNITIESTASPLVVAPNLTSGSSLTPPLGGLTLANNASCTGTLTFGHGNITLIGNVGNLTVTSSITSSTSLTLEATGNVIIQAAVQTTSSTADITVIADSGNVGSGGVYISSTGSLISARDLTVMGSDYTGAVTTDPDSVVLAPPTGSSPNIALEAARNITIENESGAPSGASLYLGAEILTTNTSINVGNIDILSPIRLTSALAQIIADGAGSIDVASSIDSEDAGAALTLHSDFGNVFVSGEVGAHNTGSDTIALLDVSNAYTVEFTQSVSVNALLIADALSSVDFAGMVTTNGSFAVTSPTLTLGAAVHAQHGPITWNTNNLAIEGAVSSADATSILTIAPINASESIGINGTGGLNLTTTEIGYIQSGFAEVVIGSATGTGAIQIGAADFASSVEIEASPASGSIMDAGALVGSGSAGITLSAHSIALDVSAAQTISTTNSPIALIGNVTLGEPAFLYTGDTGTAGTGGNITINGTLNGAVSFGAEAGTDGVITLLPGSQPVGGASIGGAAALASLTLSGHQLDLNPEAITTGSQTYSVFSPSSGEEIIFDGSRVVSTGGGSITFNGPLLLGDSLVVTVYGGASAGVAFNGAIDASGPGISLSVSAVHSIDFAGAVGAAHGPDNLYAQASSITVGGSLSVNKLASLTAVSLNLDGPAGSISVPGGDLSLSPVSASVPIWLGDGAAAPGTAFALSGAELATIGANVKVLTIGSSTDAAGITINTDGLSLASSTVFDQSSTGTVTIDGAIAGLGAASLSFSAGKVVTDSDLSTEGGGIYLSSLSIVGGDPGVTLDTTAGGATGGNVTVYGAISELGTTKPTLTVNGGAGVVDLAAIGAAAKPFGAIAIDDANLVSLNGAIAADNLQITGAPAIHLAAASITTSGSTGQTYTGAVTLYEPLMLASHGGPVAFDGAVSSLAGQRYGLSVTAGAGSIAFASSIGASLGPVGALSLSSTQSISVGGDITATSVAMNAGAAGPLSVVGVATFGTQTYTGDVSLGGALQGTTLHVGSSANITNSGVWQFSGAVSLAAGAHNITITGTTNSYGPLTLSGAAASLAASQGAAGTIIASANLTGALDLTSSGSITVDAAAASTISLTGSALNFYGNVKTTGTGGQTYTGPVELYANTIFTSTVGGIDFTNAITEPSGKSYSLEAMASGGGATPVYAPVTFGGAVATGALTVIGSNCTFDGNLTAPSLAIRGSGNVTENNLVTVAGSAAVTGGVTSFDSALNQFSTLSLAGGSATIDAGSGALTLTSVNLTGGLTVSTAGALQIHTSTAASASISSTGNITLDGNVATSGASGQIYTGSIVLGANITLTSAAGPIDVTGSVAEAMSQHYSFTARASTGGSSPTYYSETFGGAITANGLTLFGSDIAIGGAVAAPAATIHGSGMVTDHSGVAVTGLLTLAGTTMTLDSSANSFGSINLSGGSATIDTAGNLSIAGAILTGDLTVTAGGSVTQTAAITTAELVASASAGAVILNHANKIAQVGEITADTGVLILSGGPTMLFTGVISTQSGNVVLVADYNATSNLSVSGGTIDLGAGGGRAEIYSYSLVATSTHLGSLSSYADYLLPGYPALPAAGGNVIIYTTDP